jgi:hypothetical protein
MSTPIVFQHDTLITVDAPASIDAEVAVDLPAESAAVDIAVEGFANWISGDYVQNTGDINDIKSNLTVNKSTLKTAAFSLMTDIDHTTASFSTYGNIIKTKGSGLVIDSSKGVTSMLKNDGVTSVALTDAAASWFVNLRAWAGVDSNVYSGTALKHDKCSLGSVLVQTAGAALFQKLGRNAALKNDTDIHAKENKLANDISNALTESSANYSATKFFKRYLDSGRYDDDASRDTGNGPVSYALDNANFDFMIQVGGTVSDSDGDSLTDAGVLARILGNRATGEHMVNEADASYTMNLFLRMRQKNNLD